MTSHEMFAFILRNEDSSSRWPLSTYQVTVDSVQRDSGLNFFDLLPDEGEMELEQEVNGNWDVEVGMP